MILRGLKTLMIAAVTMMLSVNTFGQDLIARQAPIDKKMRAIDSVALQRQIIKEQSEFPAYDLYPNWSNKSVNAYAGATIPDTFHIDLTGFTMPTPSTKVTSHYGYRSRWRRMHNGIDLKVYTGDTIYAAFDGKVRIVSFDRRGYGNYVVIRHDNGLETIYGHFSKHLVKEDQLVKSGEPIGLGGNTGRSTGSHLHFETRFLGQAINPALLFDFPNQDVTGDAYVYYASKSRSSATMKGSSVASNAEVRYHKVRSGDSLSKIAQQRKVSIDQLCRLNNISRKTVLRLGQLIRYS